MALCHEEAVRRAFPDGIFWLSLGQEPDIRRILTDFAGMAGQSSSFASVPLAQEALRSFFADKTCLLVIDDLWRLGDARDLALLGPRGRALITTRDASLLTALAATEVALEC